MANSNISKRRSTLFITLIVSGIFLLGAGFVPLLVSSQQNALESIVPALSPSTQNFPVPRLELADLQGNPVSIDEYLGKVILVNNWATWCPPCQSEMPELQAYYSAHSAQGFVVVAIESGEPPDQVASFIKENGISFPVWLDPQGKALDEFKNWDLPSSYIVDRGGIVRLSWTGGVTRSTLEQYVTPLLENNQ